MTDTKPVQFPAILITQPIGDFYIGVMKSDDLIAVSRADVRRLHENEIDRYIGIQRRLSVQRSKELQEYVNSFDATFPTAIILAVREENASYDDKTKTLTLVSTEDIPLSRIANIIDGQHRVDGLTAFHGERFDVSVSIFVGADLATQANIFATVNLAQTKVNRSLAYDLLDYEALRSPQKVAHLITVALDRLDYSPFHKRIKRLGSATPGRQGETITQAAMVESILDLISKDPISDRNAFFRRFAIQKPSEAERKRYPFRALFLAGEDDKITQILLNYFSAVKERWPLSWDDLNRRGNVLPKTNGLKALMRFLRLVYPRITEETHSDVPKKSDFATYFSRVTLLDENFNTDIFKPGTSGEATLYQALRETVKPGENSLTSHE